MAKRNQSDSEFDRMRVQVPLTQEAIRKIDELAERMGLSRGAMAARLLEYGLEDNEWIIRLMTTSVLNPVRTLLEDWGKPTEGKNRVQSRKA